VTSAVATGLYVYGVTVPGELLSGVHAGVDGEHPVELVPVDDLIAIASRVDLDEFGEEPLAERLSDLSWLAEKAVAHEAVVERATRDGRPVLPFRFGTIYLDEEQLAFRLRGEAEALHTALRRVEGKVELAVHGVLDRAQALRHAEAERGDSAESAAGAGAAYLRRRKLERDLEDELGERGAHLGAAVHDVLAAAADEAVLNRPRALEREEDLPVLNGAYLVASDAVDTFAGYVRRLDEREDGLRLELSGPWPPYNFVGAAP
jgi:hypothetical protein